MRATYDRCRAVDGGVEDAEKSADEPKSGDEDVAGAVARHLDAVERFAAGAAGERGPDEAGVDDQR